MGRSSSVLWGRLEMVLIWNMQVICVPLTEVCNLL